LGFSFSQVELFLVVVAVAKLEEVLRAGLLIFSAVFLRELKEGIRPRLSFPDMLLLGLFTEPVKNGLGVGEFLLGGGGTILPQGQTDQGEAWRVTDPLNRCALEQGRNPV